MKKGVKFPYTHKEQRMQNAEKLLFVVEINYTLHIHWVKAWSKGDKNVSTELIPKAKGKKRPQTWFTAFNS